MYTKELSQAIRKQLKVEFPECKWSVRMSSFSGGSAVDVYLMSAPEPALKDNENWTGYAQLNEYQLRDSYSHDGLCNGADLTDFGWRTMKRVVEIMDSFGEFDNRYTFMGVNIGKWDKPFQLK